MSNKDLSKVYSPKDFEDRLYQFWIDNNLFSPQGDPESVFVVVIPPPNVTGVLHMGHALNNSLQDTLVRYWRMKGKTTLWIPGTDHAGIATQQVVERRLAQEGKTRHDLGQKRFVDLAWQVKNEHHAIICQQLKKMGVSVDWRRERFTMDEGLSQAVHECFVRLWEKDLIYKGHYLVNWDPQAQTAVSDDEVEHKEVNGFLYHIRYPLTDGSGFIPIATTRPETLFGDVALATHPQDPRYQGLEGKTLRLPISNREIPLIYDEFVDSSFGTGAVKITPAHDFHDFDVGRRHGLPKINILNPDGTLGKEVPQRYQGLSVTQAREQVVKELEQLGLFIEKQPHKHQVGHCYRSGVVIEPYLSNQWFVRMKPLAQKALNAFKQGQIRFYPKRWESIYVHWVENIRDWCISRQLWWGHQIPVWICSSCSHFNVQVQVPQKCSQCGGSELEQDQDVLDTWFSSWLWPFSTLGWPQKTDDLARFYPTTALVTAHDILFFWVARMVMAGTEFLGQVPFRDIYIHQLVRDKQGRKMSKSLGNGIDPLEVIDEVGADALKFTLVYLSSQGQDILMDKESFKLGSKFANKVWNASRYVLMNIPEEGILERKDLVKNDIDLWIEHSLNATIKAVDDNMAGYRFNDAGHAIYTFFWNDFCDWYIEASKLDFYSQDAWTKRHAVSKVVYVLDEALRLMHPFLSFLTEEIYQKLPVHEVSLVTAPFPVWSFKRDNPWVKKAFSSLQELVRGIRTLRSELTLPPDKLIPLAIGVDRDFAYANFFKTYQALILKLVNGSSLEWVPIGDQKEGSITIVGTGFESYAYIKEMIDIPKEQSRLKKNIEKTRSYVESLEKKLSNKAFLINAPSFVVEAEKLKLQDTRLYQLRLNSYLSHLESFKELRI